MGDRFDRLLASKLVESIRKEHGDSILVSAKDYRIQHVPRIKTGIFALDYALGGGFPAGRTNIVWGGKSTGKSVICTRTLANAQKLCSECYRTLPAFSSEVVPDAEGVLDVCSCDEPREHVCAYLDVEGCVSEDQEILDPWSGFVGTVSEFMDPSVDRHVISFQDGRVQVEPAPVRVDSGIQSVVQIRTRTTRLKCTPNHPVLAWRGGVARYVEAADLSPGEKIARPRRSSFEGTPTGIGKEDAELLGLLLGDGSFCSNGSVRFTNKDEQVWDRISVLADRWGVRVHRFDDRHGRLVREMSPAEHRWGDGNPLRRWLSKLKYLGQTTGSKALVGEILRAPTSIVSAALLGLWMSDGSVNPSRPSVFFTSTSRTLVVQVRWLLSRIGVLGRLHVYHDGCSEHAPWYTVTVNGREALRRFREAVPLYGRKGDLLDAWCCSRGVRVFPCADELLPGYSNSKHYRTRDQWANESDVWWDEVLDVLPIGEVRCFDVGVPGGHSWTVSDVVVHNTWDQEWAKINGVDTATVLLSVPEYAEQTLDIAEGLLRSGEVDFLVIDSLAFLTPAKEIEESTAKALQAEQARVLGRGIRKFGSALNKVGNQTGRRPTLLFTNQVRMKVGLLFGNPETQPGGNAPGFSATVEVKTHGGKYEMDEVTGRPRHVDLGFRVEKNKSAGAHMEGDWRLVLSDGGLKKKGQISEEPALVDKALALGLIEKVNQNNWKCLGESHRSKSEIVKLLATDPAMKYLFTRALLKVLLAD
jgi:RecA/RadA recombinase